MAEFTEIMRQWRRLCKGQDNLYHEDMCEHCPLYEATHERGCAAIYEDDAGEMDYAEAERVVTDWAAEHPEPKYPTWREWMFEQGLLKWHHIPNTYARETVPDWEVLLKPIPAEIARKLGVEPKGDPHG